MAPDTESGELLAANEGRHSQLNRGPFLLRTLLEDVPLVADGSQDNVVINCVEYLDGNLYVGTSASELLHFFQIPPDPADRSGSPTFILASRLRPTYSTSSAAVSSSRPGVQQILLLPQVSKACILCNWTVTFYSLPELSPVFGNVHVKNCNWIGGVDLNEDPATKPSSGGVTVLLSLNRMIRVVRIKDEEAAGVRNIDFAGSTLSVRRDSIACVADSRSYALLDIHRQLKIPLMSISSLDDAQAGGPLGQVQNIAAGSATGGSSSSLDGALHRSASSAQARSSVSPHDSLGHSRSTSLGNFPSSGGGGSGGGGGGGGRPSGERDPSASRGSSPRPPSVGPEPGKPPSETDKPLPAAPSDGNPAASANKPPPAESTGVPGAQPKTQHGISFLKPHIASPTAEEFLLVTGVGPTDPGIGMFVNLDGDPTRPTLQFQRYPHAIVVDGGSGGAADDGEEGYVLASMSRESDDGSLRHGIEIQRFDVNVGEDDPQRFWLEIAAEAAVQDAPPLGVRSLCTTSEAQFQEVVDRLCQTRFSPFSPAAAASAAAAAAAASENPSTPSTSLSRVDSRTALSIERLSKEKELFEHGGDSDEEQLPDGWEAVRVREEQEFAGRLAKFASRVAVWTGNRIWWAFRNPLLLQLEAELEPFAASGEGGRAPRSADSRAKLLDVLNAIRDRDAKTELEFVTSRYIRQKIGVMLFADFVGSKGRSFSDTEVAAMQVVLLDGDMDPRLLLALLPRLRNEIVESRRGMWVYGGLRDTLLAHLPGDRQDGRSAPALGDLGAPVLQFLRRFLTAYRQKKGFGSIADEKQVFQTVDAALLLVLLELDRATPKGSAAKPGSVRSSLYELVDHGVDCFERAADLLESYHRLFVLSRLYQSRKMSADVLATWRRILEGERDDGDDLGDGEQIMRRYLATIGNRALVEEYGVWLAARNPKLGVQVFADEKARVSRFEPAQVVSLLRREAPDAVKYYLEHLVFGKGSTAYVDELVAYYLDVVIRDLQASATSRDTVAASYEAYRALRPPKPTYHQFLADNAPPDDEVWQSRLRLLQLLGGDHAYDSAAIRARILAAFPDDDAAEQLLVPEAIILDGREGQHEAALRLLVHRLGDYDTAVSYCLRGGSNTVGIGSSNSAREDARSRATTTTTTRRLFRVLLGEFLALDDVSDRVEQTGALLQRFGGWFDCLEVLALLPDGWSVEIAAGFLAAALRRLVAERHESMLARALSSAENLQVDYERVLAIDEKGPVVDRGS
ncbi:hypothetical protein VTK73DRAFT_8905 [Phialemonium thermophilum]|uniref:CNH domain-containing protein n=1 Tax=Phialemonium thermophilum TaxID=223376 RepID=A0ABR3W5J9_9PEZI